MSANTEALELAFNSGNTTKDALRQFVSCSDITIQRFLAKKEDELKRYNLNNKDNLKINAEKTREKHLEIYRKDLEIIENAMALCTEGDKNWMFYQKRKNEQLAIIEKHEGCEISMKVAEKIAINGAEQPVQKPIDSSTNAWIPDCGDAKKD